MLFSKANASVNFEWLLSYSGRLTIQVLFNFSMTELIPLPTLNALSTAIESLSEPLAQSNLCL